MIPEIGLGIACFASAFGLASIVHSSNYIVIEPTFTSSAYQPQAFYSYYGHNCHNKNPLECLAVPISGDNNNVTIRYADSHNAMLLFKMFLFETTDDIAVNNDPSILANKTVIVLHNEYMTQKEFDAINASKSVIWLSPNSMYAKVLYNPANCDLWSQDDCQLAESFYSQDPTTLFGLLPHHHDIQPTIQLLYGHGFNGTGLDPKVTNGFSWKYDNSKYEKVNHQPNLCTNEPFTEIYPNHYQVNCMLDNPLKIISYIWGLPT